MVYVNGRGERGEHGEHSGCEDVFTKLELCKRRDTANGLGARYVRQFVQQCVQQFVR